MTRTCDFICEECEVVLWLQLAIESQGTSIREVFASEIGALERVRDFLNLHDGHKLKFAIHNWEYPESHKFQLEP